MRTPIDDPDCPFCAIASGRDHAARVVARRGDVIAFFPTEPASLGHTLVIPVAHVPDIWSIGPSLACSVTSLTLDVAVAIRRGIQPDGLNVIQSNGAAATQTVMHFHVHVVPRWNVDAIGRIWPPETHYTEDQKDAAWDEIRSNLDATSGRE